MQRPEGQILVKDFLDVPDRILYATYIVAAACASSIWFIAIRAPLWLDETISYFQIKGHFSEIYSRQGWPGVPIYYQILWLASKVLGASEIALRIPEVLAMLAAVYLLFLAASELFDHDRNQDNGRDLAYIAIVIFCLHYNTAFAAIDVRPYAFAVLATNATILTLVRLRNNDSMWLAALFGFLAASIAYFHLLFSVLLPGLAVGLFLAKHGKRNVFSGQGVVAVFAFTLSYLPVLPGLLYIFRTSGEHVFAEDATPRALRLTVVHGWIGYFFLAAVVIAAATRRIDIKRLEINRGLFCASLGLIPILILYGITAETSLHIFVPRYRMVAIPGIALLWAWLVNGIRSRQLRLLFCVALVAATATLYFMSSASRRHGYSWKYALVAAEKESSAERLPVIICSDLPESNYRPMPVGDAVKDNLSFAQLSYYPLSNPVVGLPRALNQQAMNIASNFLERAVAKKQNFLAMGYKASYPTLEWLREKAVSAYEVRTLGIFDEVEVLEFDWRDSADRRTEKSSSGS